MVPSLILSDNLCIVCSRFSSQASAVCEDTCFNAERCDKTTHQNWPSFLSVLVVVSNCRYSYIIQPAVGGPGMPPSDAPLSGSRYQHYPPAPFALLQLVLELSASGGQNALVTVSSSVKRLDFQTPDDWSGAPYGSG